MSTLENAKKIEYHGYEGIEFEFMGLPARVIMPKCKANGKWMLKTEYFTAFPAAELELLSRGWHLAFNQNINRWAEPEDLRRKAEFVSFVSREFALSGKCLPIGMSCGGLYAVKLAALVPERISALYLDAPVLNLLSCPFAVGRDYDSRSMIEEYFKATGKTLSDMLSYREHPIDLMHIVADNSIPIIMVAGDSDRVVPYSENGAILEKYFKARGKEIEVFIKEGCDHHPHGMPDAAALADLLERMAK